jgi:hypothetical protein
MDDYEDYVKEFQELFGARVVKRQRTLNQNAAMRVYFKLLADALNEAGVDMRDLRKPVRANKDIVRDSIWQPVMTAMTEKESTAELSSSEVSEVYEVVNKWTAERWGVSVPFPTHEEALV